MSSKSFSTKKASKPVVKEIIVESPAKTKTSEKEAPAKSKVAKPDASTKTKVVKTEEPAKTKVVEKAEKTKVVAKKEAPAKAPVATKKETAKSVPKKSASKKKGDDTETPVKKQRVRRVVNKETLESGFVLLQTRVEEEIVRLRQSTEKVKGVKFLRSINKAVKILKSDALRVAKAKPKKTNRTSNNNSGFMKPVRISEALAEFTGWDVEKLFYRVDVTKFICRYIKEHDLQNPDDRRQINPDELLRDLLKYDPNRLPIGKDGKPAVLTYFRIQEYIQKHFIKTDESDKNREIAHPIADNAEKDNVSCETQVNAVEQKVEDDEEEEDEDEEEEDEEDEEDA